MSNILVENSTKVVLIGAGNVATSLALALRHAGVTLSAVWSRSQESACLLGERVECYYTTDINSLPDTDIVIISVIDSALPSVAHDVAKRYPLTPVLHTAGSIHISLLHEAGCTYYGVFYPMQTFSKARVVDFSTVSIFVEGCNENVLSIAKHLADMLTDKVYCATSEQRRYLHLAAVFACNFVNASYAMAAELLKRNGLPFEAMLPLIDETAMKVHHLQPREAQTGPAQRGDTEVMERQRELLDGELKDVYDLMSGYIQKNRHI